MTEEEKIALFDAYLGGEMSAQDKLDFEGKLQGDAVLASELEEYKVMSAAIFEGEEYGQLKDKLGGIHDELYGKKKKSILLHPKFLIPIGIAAGIALLVMIIKPFGNSGDTAMNESADYVEINYDEVASEGEADDMAEEELVLDSASYPTDTADSEEEVDKLEEVLEVDYDQSLGTCFLISEKGYFITSKHLVRKRRYVEIQQRDRDVAFYTEVVYRDSVLDLAILKCSEENAESFKPVPFRFYNRDIQLGDEVFTLGYPKPAIVYTKGDVSSESGFRSDSMSYEISMPSNPGNSGSPLFTKRGDLVGLVIANNSKKQSVTYVLKPQYIQERIENLEERLDIDISKNYTKRYSKTSDMIKKYRPFVFEIK